MEKNLNSQLSAVSKTLEELMKIDNRIVVLSADVATSCKVAHIKDKFPDRYYNVGIAEQNMLSVAAGMASEGFKPFVFTFSAFASMRACEQMRMDIFYNYENVVIVGTHGGLSTAQAGSTHFSLEDIGIVQAMPNSTIIAPSDSVSAESFTRLLAKLNIPAFLRLDRNPMPNIYDEYEAEIGKGNILINGNEITIISTGCSTSEAVNACERLEREKNIKPTLIDMPTIKPIDRDLICRVAARSKSIITLEEHNKYCGLGSAIAFVLAEEGIGVPLKCLAIDNCYPNGNAVDYNRHVHKIDSCAVYNAVIEALNK